MRLHEKYGGKDLYCKQSSSCALFTKVLTLCDSDTYLGPLQAPLLVKILSKSVGKIREISQGNRILRWQEICCCC